ncbi:MAG: hypothetical protein A2Y93_08820 [Chloroflexi bacterium RBG_13_68_17]|jgi:hypothetical protein|nr:MAG: hypothetical protein A2Y93_08820 [Chloroflexi bacterium RBG_13_68_17]
MDLSLCDLVQAAARDDLLALTSGTLWACDPVIDPPPACQAGLDLSRVVGGLRQEARRREQGRERVGRAAAGRGRATGRPAGETTPGL